MTTTGVKLTGPARRDKARKAYQMALRRMTFTEIAQALDISRNLVSTLVSEEQERQWAERDNSELEAEKRRAIATYEEVIRGAWQRLGKIKNSSLNVSGLYNVIISAQAKIDGITGVQAPKEYRGSFTHEYIDLSGASEETVREIEEYLAALDS